MKLTKLMKFDYKAKRTLTQALSIVLVCLTAFGAIMGVSALSKKLSEETKIISPKFEVGGINAQGKGDKEMTGSIYTKESFECKGLEIRLDFDASVKYKVYYYYDSCVCCFLRNCELHTLVIFL